MCGEARRIAGRRGLFRRAEVDTVVDTSRSTAEPKRCRQARVVASRVVTRRGNCNAAENSSPAVVVSRRCRRGFIRRAKEHVRLLSMSMDQTGQ